MVWGCTMRAKERVFFIKRWLLTRRLFLLGLFVFLGVICGMSSLFSLSFSLVVYTSFLLIGLASGFLVIDLLAEWKRYVCVKEGRPIKKGTAVELSLQERVDELENRLMKQEEKERKHQREYQDYYTLWAHQMKIPIAASRLLVADLSIGEEREALERELFKIEQYADLVLNYLRLHSFHDDLLVQRESLDYLVRQAIKKFSIFFIQHKIELQLDPLERSIATDKKWFMLFLEQFISNAVKYTPGGKIWIYMEKDDLVIQDTGIGIKSSDIKRIFSRGFSGYNGRISQQSSGLGLYLAQQIGEKLGLAFTLDSEIGQGTQVRICLKEESLILD